MGSIHEEAIEVEATPSSPVHVTVVYRKAKPTWYTSAPGENPCGTRFLAELSRSGLPVTAVGSLRMVDAEAFDAYLRAKGKVRPRRKPRDVEGSQDKALERAGLSLVKGGTK